MKKIQKSLSIYSEMITIDITNKTLSLKLDKFIGQETNIEALEMLKALKLQNENLFELATITGLELNYKKEEVNEKKNN